MIVEEFTTIANMSCEQQDGHVPITVTGVIPSPHGPLVQWTGGSPAPRFDDGRTLGPPAAQDLCRVLARVMACRWREGRAVVSKDWRETLALRHPGVFEDGGPASWGGWRWLWEGAAELIGETKPPGFKTLQTKEKFAQIRWYYGLGSKCRVGQREEVRTIVDGIEHLSAFVCEYCGAPGTVRPGGWAKTCCDHHAKRENRELPR
ncbi:hypothetical protein [Methylobacterium sp. 37f]|uniref:hypothetical protein n=1 Tax=Methylobacterium sp. 37f TaxID=2817058 RepID=UPI001FFC6F1C|nr:hypothetical protein [Methylobacterium sp. 37f]MCK2057166.1 hypothetical protein [Methylobacterium sp. 37f]